MRWAMIVGMACALAAGCESNNGDGTGGGALAGTKWRLAGWSASSLDPSQFTITANFDEAQISGTSAVNSYGGPYRATADGSFSVGDFSVTAMAGSENAMRAEALYLDLLRQARRYAATAATLTLKNGSDQDVLIFRARESAGDHARDVLNITGTVAWKALETGFFAIDADDGQGYEPINLPREYQNNGLRVRVTALEQKDMASINMYGTIIEIVTISRL